MSYSLHSLKRGLTRPIKGDPSSLDYSSYCFKGVIRILTKVPLTLASGEPMGP